MKENVYEGLFILDSDLFARNADELSAQVSRYIEQVGGEILVSRLWEERKLAYPIKGHRRGTYWLTYFKVDTQKLKDLNRQCQISNNILRFMFLQIDPRLVDTLVEHALQGPIKVEPLTAAGIDEVPEASMLDSVDESVVEAAE